MAISRVGAATNAGNSITIPAGHQPGDLIIILALNESAATTPTTAAGYTSIGISTDTSLGGRFAYKRATSSSETSGTWTNATQLLVAVYRGVKSTTPFINTSVGGQNTASAPANNVSYSSTTAPNTNAWIVAMCGYKALGTAVETPPSNLTNIVDTLGVTSELVIHDSNGIAPNISTWSAGNVNVSLGATNPFVAFATYIADGSPSNLFFY